MSKRLEAEIERATLARASADKKLQQMKARLSDARAGLRVQRGHLPEEFPSNQASESAHPSNIFQGLTRATAPAVLDAVRAALQQESLPKIFTALGDALALDKAAICLIEQKGGKDPSIKFTTSYNPEFNEFLKKTGLARFNKLQKSWRLPDDEHCRAHVVAGIGAFFPIIVDVSKLHVWVSEIAKPASTSQVFEALTLDADVSMEEVLQAVKKDCPTEDLEDCRLYIHGRTEFESISPQALVRTRMPIVLLRISVRGGQPRYVAYSITERRLAAFVFSSSKLEAATLVGQFKDSMYLASAEAFERQESVSE